MSTRGWGCRSVMEPRLGVNEALDSVPSTERKERSESYLKVAFGAIASLAFDQAAGHHVYHSLAKVTHKTNRHTL